MFGANARFGDFSGFMSGWTLLDEQSSLLPSRSIFLPQSNLLFVRGGHWTHLSSSKSVLACGFRFFALVAITVMNIVGLNVGKWLHNIGSFGMWVPVVILVVMGVRLEDVWLGNFFHAGQSHSQQHLKDMLFWATSAMPSAVAKRVSVHGR